MALADELPVYKASYDLLPAIFNFAKSFRKSSTVGAKMLIAIGYARKGGAPEERHVVRVVG